MNPNLLRNSTNEGDKLYLSDIGSKTIVQVMPDLSLGKRISGELNSEFHSFDIDKDGEHEILDILIAKDYTLNIYRNNFKDKIEVLLGPGQGNLILSSLIHPHILQRHLLSLWPLILQLLLHKLYLFLLQFHLMQHHLWLLLL